MIGFVIHGECCIEKQLHDTNLQITVEKENKLLLGSLATVSD